MGFSGAAWLLLALRHHCASLRGPRRAARDLRCIMPCSVHPLAAKGVCVYIRYHCRTSAAAMVERAVHTERTRGSMSGLGIACVRNRHESRPSAPVTLGAPLLPPRRLRVRSLPAFEGRISIGLVFVERMHARDCGLHAAASERVLCGWAAG